MFSIKSLKMKQERAFVFFKSDLNFYIKVRPLKYFFKFFTEI